MGSGRKLKQGVYEIFMNSSEGEILMDAPTTESWRELLKYAEDKEY